MSTPLSLTEEMKNELLETFREALSKWNLATDGLKFQFGLGGLKTYENKRTRVTFSAAAYAKMYLLVNLFDSEVAWHGLVNRTEDGFFIYDILIYPQEVTGSTVNTDQTAYEMWLFNQDDNVFNHIRMQGHSHVNFGTTPSSVDTTHQEQIIEQLGDNDYYIFMIVNKKHSAYFRIVDRENNIQYDTDDVSFCVQGGGVTKAFYDEAKEMVKTKSYSYTDTGYANTNGRGIGSIYPSVGTMSAGKRNASEKDAGKNPEKQKKSKPKKEHEKRWWEDEMTRYYGNAYGDFD